MQAFYSRWFTLPVCFLLGSISGMSWLIQRVIIAAGPCSVLTMQCQTVLPNGKEPSFVVTTSAAAVSLAEHGLSSENPHNSRLGKVPSRCHFCSALMLNLSKSQFALRRLLL